MGRLVMRALITIVIIHVLILVGALGYGLATHRFSKDRVDQYLATWNGAELVEQPEETVEEAAVEDPTDAMARIAEMEIKSEALLRNIQRQLELLRSMKFSVQLAQEKVNEDRQELQGEHESFLAKIDDYEQRVQAEGFQQALKNYSSLKPKLVKEDFMQMDDNEAVRYLSKMKPDVATRILNYFRTPEEQAKRQRLLQLLKTHESFAGNM